MPISTIITYCSVLAAATLLSIWSGTLIIRMIAEWRERRAVARIRRRWEERRIKEGGNASDVTAAIPAASAAPRVRRGRDVVIVLISPVLLIVGLVIAHAVIGAFAYYDLISRSMRPVTFGLVVEIAGAISFLAAWWWLGKTLKARSCPRCAYDMQMVAGNRCPECGLESEEQSLTRRRSRWVLLVLPALLIPCSYMTFKWESFRSRGWFALVPTSAIIAVFEHIPVEYVLEPRNGDLTSLEHRRDEMWMWQKRWLMHRAEDVVRSSSDPAEIEVAKRLARPGHFDTYEPEMSKIILGWLLDPNPTIRGFGGELVSDMLRWDLDRERKAILAKAAPSLFADLEPALARGDPYFFDMATVCSFSPAHREDVVTLLLSIVEDGDSTRSMVHSAIITAFTIGDDDEESLHRLLELATRLSPEVARMVLGRLVYSQPVPDTQDTLILMTAYPDHEVASLATRNLARQEDLAEGIQMLLATFDEQGRVPSHFSVVYHDGWLEYAELSNPQTIASLMKLCEDAQTPAEARYDMMYLLCHFEGTKAAGAGTLHARLQRVATDLCEATNFQDFEVEMMEDIALELARRLDQFEQGRERSEPDEGWEDE